MKGMVKAVQLLIQGMGPMRPNQVTVMKLGTHVTASGSIIVLNNKVNRRFLPGNSMLAKA